MGDNPKAKSNDKWQLGEDPNEARRMTSGYYECL